MNESMYIFPIENDGDFPAIVIRYSEVKVQCMFGIWLRANF